MLERLKSFTDIFFVRSRIIALSAFIVLLVVFSDIYAAIYSPQKEDPVEDSEVEDNIQTELEALPPKAPYAESFTGYEAEAVVLFRKEYEKSNASRTYSENLKITTASGIVTAVSGGTMEAVFPSLSADGDKALFISSAVELRRDTERIELPDSLVAILSENTCLIDAGGAFSESTSLESVYLPKGLKYIGNKAFFDCNLLSDICIPYLTDYIGNEAFAYCASLSEIGVYGNTAIDDNAFTGCSALSEVYLSDRVTRVGISAFENTPFFDSLTEEFAIVGDILIKYNGDGGDVKIPEGVRIIGDGVFAGRISIKSLQLPESLEYIGNSAFRSCARLEKVTFAQGDEVFPEIGENAFDGCAKLDFESLDAIEKLAVNSRREFYFEDTARDILKTKIKRFDASDICDTTFFAGLCPTPLLSGATRPQHPSPTFLKESWTKNFNVQARLDRHAVCGVLLCFIGIGDRRNFSSVKLFRRKYEVFTTSLTASLSKTCLLLSPSQSLRDSSPSGRAFFCLHLHCARCLGTV